MYPKDSIITDEVGNEERNKHTTSRDLSKSHSLVKAEKHAESPTSEPKLQLAASNEEVRLERVLPLLLPQSHALPL